MNLTKILLKNGIKEMLSENEEHFEKNIQQALSLKLNDCIFSVRKEVSNRLFENNETTIKTPELLEFIDFINKFTPGNFLFKDGSVININEKEKDLVKNLFESLNTENRKLFTQEIFKNGLAFKQHIELAKQTGKLQ